jgi:DNA-binding NarL/FixJ family response regulator
MQRQGKPQQVRVLLADDHAGMRHMLRDLIEHDGACVVCAEATNGEEAVCLALKFRPDIAVLDMSMPVMDGLEATRKICALLPDTAVLIVTLHDTAYVGDLARHAGARALLSKSDAADHLSAAIRMMRHADIATPVDSTRPARMARSSRS